MAFAIAELEELSLIESPGSWDSLNRLNLCFLGMAAMYDPPRDTALEALQTMKNAGLINFHHSYFVFFRNIKYCKI